MNVLVDGRWIGPHGIGRFAREVIKRIPDTIQVSEKITPLSPLDPAWLSFEIARKKPDIYFSPGFNPPVYSSIPFIFTIHDLIHLKFKGYSSPSKKLFYNLVVYPAIKKAANVLTVSEYSKKEIVEWTDINPQKIVVVGNGVGTEFSIKGAKFNPGYPYLLYVGNRKPHKNIPRLLKAFALSKLGKELRLILSGTPDADTVSLIERLNIQQSVIFAGVIPDVDLPDYYRGAIGLVFPSLYEGFGLPPLEAMASGTPVLTSNTTSLPEVVAEAALMINPCEVEEIVSGLQKIVTNDTLRQQLRLKGLKQAKKFTWDRTAKLVLQTLQKSLR